MAEIDHVGFTGSRLGMTPWQRKMFKLVLISRIANYGVGIFHHGLCIGSDAEAHEDAFKARYQIFGHPPIKEDRVYPFNMNEFTWIDRPFSFGGRNQRIIIACKVLIATPRAGSVGTFNAISHAELIRKPRIIIRENEYIDFLDCQEKDFI